MPNHEMVAPDDDEGVLLSSSPPLISFVAVPRQIEVYAVTRPELDTLISFYNSIHIAFLGLATGALIAFSIILSTVDDLGARTHQTFVALTAVSAISTLYFAGKTIFDLRAARQKVADIRKRTVP